MEKNSLMDFINGGITLLVGLVAWIVYLLSKRTEKTNAAVILIMDIRNAERMARTLSEYLETNDEIDISSVMHGDENWKKYQHLFVSLLDQDELLAFNNFFESCNAIAKSQRIATEVIYTSYKAKAKAEAMQQIILTEEYLNNAAKKEEYIFKANKEPFAFKPLDPKNNMSKALAQLGVMSTTTAFSRMKEISEPAWYKIW